MSTEKSDFLKFNAYQIKDLITRKLTEDTRFTDQIYEGSNLAILIDVVSYMFQCLMYQLNNAAAESMFSDTQLFENMNRLCRLIGYSPRGVTPAKMEVYVNAVEDSLDGIQIPKYSYIDTGLTDDNGKSIYFSTVKKNSNQTETINNEEYHRVTLYNGKWKLHNTIFTASGNDYETFILNGVQSNQETKQFVAGDFIDVYVEDSNGKIEPWFYDKYDIFHVSNNSNYEDDETSNPQFSKLYNGQDKIYQIRINEDHTYEIKFGNGVSGKRLTEGDKVYVFYLDTNGEYGKIDTSLLNQDLKFVSSNEQFGITKNLYKKIILNDTDIEDAYLITSNNDNYQLVIDNTVTTPLLDEDVEGIRENSPEWFKTGNRLITKNDYEYFFKNQIDGGVADVKCMNNWQYMTSFYAWLYKLGKDNHDDAQYYLNETRFNSYFGTLTQAFTDAADQNNVYMWIKYENSEYDVNNIIKDNQGIENIKTLTTQTQYMKPIDVYFDICAAPDEVIQEYFENGDSSSFGKSDGINYDSYIEVTLDDGSMYVNNSIEYTIISKIKSFFDINKCKLGQIVNFSDLTNELYAINGVKNIRTVYDPYVTENTIGGVSYGSRVYDGLSFASWSNGFIDLGDDAQVSNTQRNLNDFQFPVLFNINSLGSKIKIVKKQLNNTNYIKF